MPLTVTDPTMTRFLMSLTESVDLVEYAFENAADGDLFVRKAPASTVADLAAGICQVLGVPTDIRVIGGRHGEKLYESLLSVEEMAKAEDHGDYFRVPLDARSLDYGLYTDEGSIRIDNGKDYNSHNAIRMTSDEVADLLRYLPEFQPMMGG
jgi:UDP-glucose 4-epimerase